MEGAQFSLFALLGTSREFALLTFEVPGGDLEPGKEISLDVSGIPDCDKLELSTDDIVHSASDEEVAQKADPDGYAAEIQKREDADARRQVSSRPSSTATITPSTSITSRIASSSTSPTRTAPAPWNTRPREHTASKRAMPCSPTTTTGPLTNAPIRSTGGRAQDRARRRLRRQRVTPSSKAGPARHRLAGPAFFQSARSRTISRTVTPRPRGLPRDVSDSPCVESNSA